MTDIFKIAAKRWRILRRKSRARKLETGNRKRQTTSRKLFSIFRFLVPATCLQFVFLVALTGVFLYTRAGAPTRVYAATSSTLNFQARLLSGSGAIVPDGTYSVQFKLYNVVSGGVAQWTETQGSVTVKSGYLSVYLGSGTSFPGTIDWSQEQWLTMNVNSDGEMSPRLKLTAVPYAFRAGQADSLTNGASSLTASNLAQLGPAAPQAVNLAVAALRISQTGAGGLLQLQQSGTDVFTVANNGDLTSSGSATFSGGSLTLGTATQIGGLVLKDGAGKKGTVQTTTLSADQTYTFPNTSGTICLTTTCTGAANSFVNGGNSFGSAPTLGTNDNFALNFRTNNTNQLTLDTSGNLNLLNGGLQVGSTTVLTSARVLQNVTADTSILTTGTLGVTRGGTGLASYTVGDLLYASGTTALASLSDVATGNVLISGGVGAAPSWGKVTLGTHTTGNYVASLGSLTGLSVTGNTGAGSTPALSVIYGSAANNAAAGANTFICPSGTGNLSGGGTTVTIGTSGTTCAALDTITNPTFSGLLTASKTGANAFAVTGAPTNSATSSLIQIAAAIASGNTAANGGTYLGLNAPNTGAGSAADFLNFQVNGTYKLKIDNTGLIDTLGGLAVNATTVITSARVLQNVTADTSILTSGLLGVARGGTGAGTFTTNGILFGNGTSAFGVTGAGTTGQCLVATTSAAPAWGSCAGAGSGVSLQSAYTGGATITTTDAKDISFTLANTTTASNFLVNIATGSTSKFAVQNNGTDVLRVTAAGTVINTGGLTISAGGASITGTVTLSSLNASGVVHTSGSGQLSTGAVVLGTDTSGNYVASLGSLTGLSASGNTGAGSTPALSVLYGSGANTAVQGNTTFTCPSGTGNLSGGGTVITLGTGGTCSAISITSAPTFSGLITASNTGGTALALTGAPTNSATSSLIQIGAGIASGNTATNGGTYLGLNAPNTGAGSAADFLNFQVNGTYKLKVDNTGLIDSAGGLAIGGTTVITSGRVLQNVTLDAGLVTSGLLPASRGGTGLNGSTAANGQLLIGNGSGYTLATLANNGGLTITNSAGGIGLAVNYGATSTSAVRGDTSLICPSGTGNLSGTGNTITLGTGGTCNALDTKTAVTFTSSVTTPLLTNAGALTISTTGSNDLTLTSGSGLLVLNASTLRRTTAGTTTFDLVDGSNTTLALTNSGAGNLNLTADGTITAGTGLTVTSGGASITGNTSVASGTFTSSGGLISLNDTSNFGTNINTGSSTGTITLGGGSAPLVINSTAFKVTSGGALSGITTIGLSGAISGGTTYTGSSTINTSGGTIQTNTTDRVDNSGNLVNIGNLTGSGAVTVTSTGGSNALTLTSGSGTLILGGSTNTIQRSAAGLTFDVANGSSNSTLTITNSGSGVANLSVEGGITAGTNSAFSVNGNGDITGVMNQLDGTSTTNGTSGALPPSTSLTLTNATLFDVGNYVQINDTNCGGTGVNPCYAKITAKAGNVLTISPGLTWTTGKNVFEYHIPEIGGIDTSQSLSNRYGRGYFISGVATGNGTTYYNENSIETSLTTFDLLNTSVTTLNIGGAATTLKIGNASGTTTIAGNVTFSGNVTAPSTGTAGYLQRSGINLSPANSGDNFTTSGNISTSSTGTITAAAGLTVQGGGASIVGNSSVTGTLGVSSTLTVSAGGASIAGGLTLASGALNLTSGGITNAGDIAGAVTITSSGNINSSGGGIQTGGTTRIDNSGNLVNIAGITNSGAFTISSGGTGGITLDSANGKLILSATDTILQRTATGTYTIDLADAGTTTLALTNSLAGISNLDITKGGLSTAGTLRLTNGGALQNITGLTISSGGAAITGATSVSSGSFSSSGGLISLNAGSNFNTSINTGTSTGTITLGGGAAPLVINSTAFSVTSAGALSGITTLGLSGAITGATATNTINGLIINSGALSGITTMNASGLETLSSGTTALALTGAPTNSATASLVQIGSAIASGNNVASGGTYIGLNLPNAGAGSAADFLNFQKNGTSVLKIDNSGNLNTTGVYQKGGVSGVSITCTGNNYLSNMVVSGGIITGNNGCMGIGLSDQRLKKNIVSLSDDILTKIQDVNTVNFDFDCTNPYFTETNTYCDPTRQTGVIAQQLAQVFPELTYQDEHGIYHVKYDALSIYSLKAVSELAKKTGPSTPDTTNGVQTGGTLRLTKDGGLQNITGFNVIFGGASITGGINNNSGGFTNVGAVGGATTIDAQALTLHAGASGDVLKLTKDNNGVFTIFNNGALEIKLDASNAFAVKKANGDDVFSVNTAGGLVRIGSATDDNKAILLVLDSLNTAADPTGVNGAQYYNSNSNKFRCFQDGKWQDCLSAAATSEYVLAEQTQTWQQPVAETEFPESRTWVDLSRARELRLTIRLSVAGAETAKCRLQYASDDNGPWSDLSDQPSAALALKSSGSLKTEWAAIKMDARKEGLVRVVCSGGNYDEASAAGAVPKFGGIKLQIR